MKSEERCLSFYEPFLGWSLYRDTNPAPYPLHHRNQSGRKGGHILFNDTLNTFYLPLYGVRHVVKDHSYSERGNLLLPLHRLLFPINCKGSFICTIPDRIAHTFVRGTLSGMRNSLMDPPWRIEPWADAPPWSYILLSPTPEPSTCQTTGWWLIHCTTKGGY